MHCNFIRGLTNVIIKTFSQSVSQSHVQFTPRFAEGRSVLRQMQTRRGELTEVILARDVNKDTRVKVKAKAKVTQSHTSATVCCLFFSLASAGRLK